MSSNGGKHFFSFSNLWEKTFTSAEKREEYEVKCLNGFPNSSFITFKPEDIISYVMWVGGGGEGTFLESHPIHF